MTNHSPSLISFGMPVYNGAPFIREAVESILSQDYSNLELVICDNASTDGTVDICVDLASRDARIKLHRLPANVGALENFRRVLELSVGEFFAWAAHDDLWEPGFATACIQKLMEEPDAILCHPWVQCMDGTAVPMGPPCRGFLCGSERPRERFRIAIQHAWGAFAFYGVYRREWMKPFVLRPILSSDVAFIAEIAINKRIVEVEGLHWRYRYLYRPDRNGSWADFFKAVRGEYRLAGSWSASWAPWATLAWHYLDIVWKHSGSLDTKMLCSGDVLWWYVIDRNLPRVRRALGSLVGTERLGRVIKRMHRYRWYKAMRHL